MAKPKKEAIAYGHSEEALLRPDIGTQAQFKNKKTPKQYRYDSSLSPALNWDGQNPARELGEWLLDQIAEASRLDPPHEFAEARLSGGLEIHGLADAVQALQALSKPFLDWSGKAEKLSFDVPTLPLFVHERLSTKAILETLAGHERDQQMDFQLFGDPQLPLHEQLEAYQHKGGWVNRMILGDSLVVMNSLLEYEGLGEQVQAIYIDPPYGVKFGSNFQPFVRRREVKNNDDSSMTREPEMVKAYRDTWELGLHSYLTYLRDRLLVTRELLTNSGSVFVQISDENVHHVRELLDEIFGPDNFVSSIAFVKTTSSTSNDLSAVYDQILWYAKDAKNVKYRQLFVGKARGGAGATGYTRVRLDTGEIRPASEFEDEAGELQLPDGASLVALDNITSQSPGSRYDVEFEGRTYRPEPGYWKTDEPRMARLIAADRIVATKNKLAYLRKFDDFPVFPLANVWTDTLGQNQFGGKKLYAVQTALPVVERCLLMTTDPGDLVVDPTCGSGTTAYVAEQWGRRWITIDTSRVPLALARQRLLTARYPYYELQDQARGPSAGFVYRARQNRRGKQIGGIVPHVTLKSIANDEPPAEEVLVDRPEVSESVTRVSGPFVFEATIPTPADAADTSQDDGSSDGDDGSYFDRMLEALKRDPSVALGENRTVSLGSIRASAQGLTLSAEAEVEPEGGRVAIVFGPENGAVGEKLVYEAAREAHMGDAKQLLIIGFAIEPTARSLVEKTESQVGIPATYIQATPDLVMGDLLKTMRSSQLFSVSGLPDIRIHKVDPAEKGGPQRYSVELMGLDTFDPATFKATHRGGDDVPAWFLDTAWNGMAFHVSQAFFPRTSAWGNLKKALKGTYDEDVWDHLSGTISAPFSESGSKEVAVKVIDDRGNELLITRALDEE